MAWSPKFSLDLTTASAHAFDRTVEAFATWRKEQSKQPRDIDLTNGWRTITPEDAENMLLHNNGNRKPTLTTVKYYAKQMVARIWMKTGEPVIFSSDGYLVDAGHRLWASYLSGASFDTYFVGDVPPSPDLFAFVDNGKVRTAADALATAGLNGLSKRLAMAINIAMKFEHGHYSTSKDKKTMDRLTPVEVLHYAQGNENLRQGCHLMAGEYKSATTVLGYADVASFTASKILEIYDEEVLDRFMSDLGRVGDDEHADGSPIAALQKVMEDDKHSVEPMKRHQVLGYAIKAFNAYVLGETVKKLTLKVNEAFPKFVLPRSEQEAA